MEALLGTWGVVVVKARNSFDALRLAGQLDIDAVLADCHLGDGIDGLGLLRRMHASQNTGLAAALITADHSADLADMARAAGYPLLHKPLRPAALRALLGAFRRRPRSLSASGSH
jgi:DNA-binding response OmpR family regulator